MRPTPALVCLLLANLLDGVLTLVLLQLDIVYEVNPLLASAYRVSPVAFMVVKMLLASSFVLVTALLTDRKVLRWAARFFAIVYVAIVAYQITLVFQHVPH